MDEEEIIATVIALDISYRALLEKMRDQLPGLAIVLKESLDYAAKARIPGLPERVQQLLAEHAALLTKRPSA